MISSLLASTSWRCYNRRLAQTVGAVEAIVVSELADREDFYGRSGKLVDWYFFATYEEMAREVGLGEKQFSEAVKRLVALGLVDTKLASMPRKKHYRLAGAKIAEFLTQEKIAEAVASINDKKEVIETPFCQDNKWQKGVAIIKNATTENFKQELQVVEKKKEKKPLDEAIRETVTLAEKTSPELAAAIEDFVRYRKEIRKPFKTTAGFYGFIKELGDFSGNDSGEAVKIIRQSILKEWRGIFPLRDSKNSATASKGTHIPVFD